MSSENSSGQQSEGEPGNEVRFLSLHARYGSEVVSVIGPDNTLLYESDSVEAMLGCPHTDEALATDNRLGQVHPEDVESVAQAMEACFATPGESPSVEYRIKDAEGNWRWLESRGVNILDDPEVGGVVVSTRDVTDRKQAEEALKESERRFRQLFEQLVDAVVVHDSEGNVADANQQVSRYLGYSREELLSMKVGDYETKLLSQEERAERERAGGTLWQRIVANEPGTVIETSLGENRRKDGTTFPVEVQVGGVDYGGRRMVLSSIRDITERKALEERLKHQALHDPLTGLPGRELLNDRLCNALAHAERVEESVAVVFVDVDDLKLVNDSLGHEAGDRMLCTVGERLKECVREEDTVARISGDEFVILLGSSGAEEHALLVSDRILQELDEPLHVGGREIPATVSMGIAVGPHPGQSAGELIRQADAAMYRAKEKGKAKYEVFEEQGE